MEEMEEFEQWCKENNGSFTDNIPCPEGEICLAVVTAGCNFSQPYATTTTTTTKNFISCQSDKSCPEYNQKFCKSGYKCFFKCVLNKCELQEEAVDPEVTTTTLPKNFLPANFKCSVNLDCSQFKREECPDREGIVCKYKCLDNHCV